MRKSRVIKRLAVLIFTAAMFISVAVCAQADDGSAFTAGEQAFIDSCGTLRVGYVQDRIPVSYIDDNGELAGISRYIFDRIQRLSGLEFEYIPLPGGDVTYAYLMENDIDLVTSVEYNEENQKARGILISDPYLSSRKVMVARQGFTYSPDAALSVALSTGSQTLKKVLNDTYPNYTILDYDTIDQCFNAVNQREADVMILNQYVVEYWLYKPAYENLKVIPLLELDDKLCFSAIVPYDANGQPVGTESRTLIDILDKAIAMIDSSVTDSFTIQAVMEKRYTFTARDFIYQYRYSLIIISGALLLIGVLFFLLTRQRIQSVKAKADADAKSRFLSTMSHEIRTPLNGLIGLNYLMSHKLDDAEQLAKYLDRSTATAKYLLSLVNDILDMSTLHNEDMRLEHRPVDLPVLLSTVETVVRGGMAEKKIDFSLNSQLGWPNILGDAVRIQQVLLNLLDNARKFTPEGGSVSVSARQAMAGGAVLTQIDVSDTGRGMSEAFQKNIFDAFAQERDSVSKGDQGVGLGLSICHKLAKLMDGDLSFTSVPGKGSVFTFTFSAQPADAPAEPAASTPRSQEDKARILVAEDNELNSEIMLDLLEESGFKADLAANGREALELFSASEPGKYGVILMDLLMPEMDGYEAALAIRALRRPDAKSVRIFACSANCTAEDREKAMMCGMDDFLAKPIDLDSLLSKLNN